MFFYIGFSLERVWRERENESSGNHKHRENSCKQRQKFPLNSPEQ